MDWQRAFLGGATGGLVGAVSGAFVPYLLASGAAGGSCMASAFDLIAGVVCFCVGGFLGSLLGTCVAMVAAAVQPEPRVPSSAQR